jgi:N-acetyl-anhydromuramyl-L-alanine amidase AmpD
LGICLTGNFQGESPSKPQLDRLSEVLCVLMSDYNIDPNNVLGHGEAPGASTLCPGKNLLSWLKDWRQSNKKTTTDEIVVALQEVIIKIQNIILKLRG